MSGHFEMLIYFGDYIHSSPRKAYQRLANQTSAQAERLY